MVKASYLNEEEETFKYDSWGKVVEAARSIKSGDKYSAVSMTAFGETSDESAFFTGKPQIGEHGYAFLFRNYRPDNGKWQTSDPLGYPDGWNNFAYCNNGVTFLVDILGFMASQPTPNGYWKTIKDVNVNDLPYQDIKISEIKDSDLSGNVLTISKIFETWYYSSLTITNGAPEYSTDGLTRTTQIVYKYTDLCYYKITKEYDENGKLISTKDKTVEYHTSYFYFEKIDNWVELHE